MAPIRTLRQVDLSDFIIARVDINIHSCGTYHEIVLADIEKKALEMGCCKLTLETQENNTRARQVYEAAGFAQAMYQAEAGGSLFYSKPLVLLSFSQYHGGVHRSLCP